MARACVFAPSPLLTVTIEPNRPDSGRHDGEGELHIHAGGQGFWIARMVAALGVDVVLCGTFGGETGEVLRSRIAADGVLLREIAAAGSNGAYVHDRRSGERVEVAVMTPATLSRHEVDELYGATLVEALDSDVCVLGGPSDPGVLPPDVYRRLAADLRRNGTPVVADLSGEPLDAALEGGLDVVKVSHEELLRDGRVASDDPEALLDAMYRLRDSGVGNVIVTRAEDPALALIDGEVLTITPPRLDAVDERGAGDSLTAGITVAVARGESLASGLRVGAAAGALNVTRRGLATGKRDEIERFAAHVEIGDDAPVG